MFLFRSLLMATALLGGTALPAAAPPVSNTPGAIRLGSDRLRVGGGRVVVSPNGRLLASSETGGVCLWELPSGKVVRRFEYADYYEGVPYAFCPESRWLALTLEQSLQDDSGRKSSFGLIDVLEGKRVPLLDIDGPLNSWTAAFLNRGRAACCLVWSSPTKSEVTLFDLHVWALPSHEKAGRIKDVTCFATAPGSDVVVTGYEDGSLRIYKAGDLAKFASIRAHSQPVEHIALSPDGRLLASRCADEKPADKKSKPRTHLIKIWDVGSRKRLRTFHEFAQDVSELFFNAAGKLCCVSRDHLNVYDAETGRAVLPAPIEHYSFGRPSFSPDCAEVVSVREDRRVEIHRVGLREPVRVLRDTPKMHHYAAFANEGRGVVILGNAGENDRLRVTTDFGWRGTHCGVWDGATGAALHDQPGHRAKITQVAYSRDGQTLISLDEAGELRLSRLPSGAPHPSFSPKAAGWVMHFQITPNGKALCVVTIDGRVDFWDIASGRRVRSADLFGKALRDEISKRAKPFWSPLYHPPLGDDLAIDPTCRVAVVRSSDTHLEVVRLDSGKRSRIPFGIARVNLSVPIVLSQDGRYLAASREYGFGLWDLSSGEVLLDPAYGGAGFAFSPHGRYFAWGEGNDVRLFDLRDRQEAGRLLSDDENFLARKVTFDADSETLAASDGERIVYWDPETKMRRATGLLRENASSSMAPQMIPLGSGAVLGSETFLVEDRSVRTKDVATGMGLLPQMSFPEGSDDYRIAVSPDGRVIAAGGRVVTLIERFTGKEIARLPRYHRGLVSAMAFSPDGKTLATGATDASVFVWDWRALSGSKPRKRSLSPGELVRCSHGLAGENAGPAYASMGLLAGDPAGAARLCRQILAESKAEAGRVGRALRALDDDSFEVRGRATRYLAGLGGEWQGTLRASSHAPSAEVRRRIARLYPTVRRAEWSPLCIRKLRAIALLEEVGTPAARAILVGESKGPNGHPATREVNASLTRMKE